MKTRKPCWDDLPKNYAMKSHGHVTKHPDGRLARCGGPSLCSECQLESYYLELLQRYRKATSPRIVDARVLALDIIEAIGGDRKFWSETQKEAIGKVQQMLIDSKVTNHAKE